MTSHNPAIHLVALVVAIGLAISPVSAQFPELEPRTTLNGVVVDGESGARIPGASVILIEQAAPVFTDEAGRFSFSEVRPGTRTLIVTQLGYDSIRTDVRFTGPEEPVTVALNADPVVLQRVEVLVDRLVERRRRAPTSVRAFDQAELRESADYSALELVMRRTGLRPVPCTNRPLISRPCAFVRGRTRPVQVFMDGMNILSGIDVLETIPPDELYTLEVYGGGSLIRAYTTWFIESVAKGRPLPPDIYF